MPTYEFRCPKGHEFEKFYRSISAAPREVFCPTCGKDLNLDPHEHKEEHVDSRWEALAELRDKL